MSITRRTLVTSAAVTALAPLARCGAAAAAGRLSTRGDASSWAAALSDGETDPSHVQAVVSEALRTVNPILNAVISSEMSSFIDRAGDTKPGPFAGVPLFVKDMTEVAGYGTSFGSRAFSGYTSTVTDAFVQRLVDCGFVYAGKTTTAEFGLTATTEPAAFGACRNPWNTEHSPGGSSGGAAAAVAAGIAPIAHGNSGGGSLRIPAACCGLVGFKASRGRLEGFGDDWTFAVPGVLAKSIRDVAQVLAGTERQTPLGLTGPVGLVSGPTRERFRVITHSTSYTGFRPDDEVAAAVDLVARSCARLGHSVSDQQPLFDGAAFMDDFMIVWGEIALQMRGAVTQAIGAPPGPELLEPLTLDLAEYAAVRRGAGSLTAAERLSPYADQYNQIFADCDIVVCPTIAGPAPKLGDFDPMKGLDAFMAERELFAGYTPIHNVAGATAVSLPVAIHSNGLPLGVQLAAAPGRERVLLELAYELEQELPWITRLPTVHASRGAVA